MDDENKSKCERSEARMRATGWSQNMREVSWTIAGIVGMSQSKRVWARMKLVNVPPEFNGSVESQDQEWKSG